VTLGQRKLQNEELHNLCPSTNGLLLGKSNQGNKRQREGGVHVSGNVCLTQLFWLAPSVPDKRVVRTAANTKNRNTNSLSAPRHENEMHRQMQLTVHPRYNDRRCKHPLPHPLTIIIHPN
jgi:hypothetical protein